MSDEQTVCSVAGHAGCGELSAIVTLPLKHARFGQIDNVVPFVRPVDSAERR
jgi:hypothetical protein